MLKFIGNGSAFNTKSGNTSAYYKVNNQMLLIDCGSTTFSRMKERNLLDDINHVHVLLTHTHADHVGSLADLVFYMFFMQGELGKPKVTVYAPSDVRHELLLEINGCFKDVHYHSVTLVEDASDLISNLQTCVTPIRTKHVPNMASYSYKIVLEAGTNLVIWYSGDTNMIPDSVLNKLDELDVLYIDTCKADYENNPHLSLNQLETLIPKESRHKVWCMYLDEGFEIEQAKSLGFNVTTVD